jgi:hypothetical protein
MFALIPSFNIPRNLYIYLTNKFSFHAQVRTQVKIRRNSSLSYYGSIKTLRTKNNTRNKFLRIFLLLARYATQKVRQLECELIYGQEQVWVPPFATHRVSSLSLGGWGRIGGGGNPVFFLCHNAFSLRTCSQRANESTCVYMANAALEVFTLLYSGLTRL